jgi:hypothetical protein
MRCHFAKTGNQGLVRLVSLIKLISLTTASRRPWVARPLESLPIRVTLQFVLPRDPTTGHSSEQTGFEPGTSAVALQ